MATKKVLSKPKLKVKVKVAPEPEPEPLPPPEPLKPIKIKGKGVAKPAAAEKPAKTAKGKTAAGFARPEMVLPTSSGGVLNNLVARETAGPSGDVEPISETVHILQQLTSSISRGDDIGNIRTAIVRISSNQPEKADVFQSILNLINQERVSDAVFMRAGVEKVLKRAIGRGDLSTSECLAVWEMSNDIIRDYEAKAGKQNKAVDTITVVEKVDLRTMEAERITQQKWSDTTPQGRQIIRMKLFDLKRSLEEKAKLKPPKKPTKPAESTSDADDEAVIDIK